jgi:FecR protein
MNQKNGKFVLQAVGIFGLAVLACGTVLLVPSLRADDADAPQAGRAVRLSNVDGEVHLSLVNQELADKAVANTPLFEGTRIDTGAQGRAEVQFEDGSVARISPQSSVTLTVLRGLGVGDTRDAEIQLNGGLGYFELQGDGDTNHMRVRFGDSVVTASGFTVIRINLDKTPGEVAVFSGNAHLEGAGQAIDLHGGESVSLNGADPNGYNLAESIEPDSWDAWNSDRDQELTTAAANHTDATNNLPDNRNPAWSDLDANGNWYNVPDQGYVWSPSEASSPGWDPYGNGYWMDTPGYGYSWISGEPWGYMPYQCGAWNYYNSFGWGWAPGMCSPWWAGGGGWIINIGIAPPRYHYPVLPRRPHDPRPGGGEGGRPNVPRPLIAVNRNPSNSNIMPAPRDRTGTVMIAGNVVRPLRPVQQVRVPYNNGSYNSRGSTYVPPTQSITRPGTVFEGSPSARPVAVPGSRQGGSYTPSPAPRPSGSSYAPAPRPSGSSYSPPPRSSGGGSYAPSHVSAPSSPPPSHPSGGGGGGSHPSGGSGPHR